MPNAKLPNEQDLKRLVRIVTDHSFLDVTAALLVMITFLHYCCKVLLCHTMPSSMRTWLGLPSGGMCQVTGTC